jgi:hypothetical protein
MYQYIIPYAIYHMLYSIIAFWYIPLRFGIYHYKMVYTMAQPSRCCDIMIPAEWHRHPGPAITVLCSHGDGALGSDFWNDLTGRLQVGRYEFTVLIMIMSLRVGVTASAGWPPGPSPSPHQWTRTDSGPPPGRPSPRTRRSSRRARRLRRQRRAWRQRCRHA